MAVGDDIFLNEDMYLTKIGLLIMMGDIYIKRIAAKDKYIIELEAKLAEKEKSNEETVS